MRFAADVAHVPHARRWVVRRAAEAGAPDAALRVVGLLASELVTNAVRHGPPDGEVAVVVERRGRRLRVVVRDDSPASPVLRESAPTAPSGRGVMIVDRLADAWGVDGASPGKAVWFEVAI